MPEISMSNLKKILNSSGLPMMKSAVEASPKNKKLLKTPEAGFEDQTRFLSPAMIERLNQQVGDEAFASYAYYGASAWFRFLGLDGFAGWAEKQGADEIGHARKIFKYLIEAGGPIELPPILSPVVKYDGVEQVMHAILQHEKAVTNSWREIGELALKEKDMATMTLVDWFINEQLEEEDKVMTLYQKVRMAKDGTGLLVIDAVVGK